MRAQIVSRILKTLRYSLHAARKTVEGKQYPDRNAQFEYIKAKRASFIRTGRPMISVGTKKKELVGNFKNGDVNGGRKDSRSSQMCMTLPIKGSVRRSPTACMMSEKNCGFVNVGVDHDTGAFSVASIEAWWIHVGSKQYPHARSVYVTADAGGSNGYRLRLWKHELQRLADKYRITFYVSHYPPGTIKWNKIEHMLFSSISLNWRGVPLRTFDTILNLISSTKTDMGLVVKAQMDWHEYPLNTRITDAQMRDINIEHDEFHGEWNYAIRPRLKS